MPPAVIPHYEVPLRRMVIALGVSLLVHYLLVGGWGSGTTPVAPVAISLQARLEPVPAPLPAPEQSESLPDSTNLKPEPLPRRASPAATAQSADGAGLDLRFYLARELDQYPSPLSTLHLGQGYRGSARLWVSIDQTGRVLEAAVIDADPPGEFERLARERVLATPFAPAWRDGRPVKSRVLLVLGGGA